LRKPASGSNPLFWEDPWLDGGALKDSFGRLCIVARERKIKVKDWRRELFQWQND